MKKNVSYVIISLAIIVFIIVSVCNPIKASAQYPMGLFPPPPVVTPYAPILPPVLFPPAPTRVAAQLTATVALPTPVVAPAPLPIVPAPIISTTQLFLGLLLRIGEESGLFYTNPALFWYLVGLLY
ncbi:MAG: hypothetical protein ACMUJM_14740 [bacterium]